MEVLLLFPFVLLLFVLLTNVGYGGSLHRQTQAAMQVTAFEYTQNVAEMNSAAARASVESLVNNAQFSGEENPAAVSVRSGGAQGLDSVILQFLGSISSRQTVSLQVERAPPFEIFPATPINKRLIVTSNTWTYCEMKDKAFEGSSAGAEIGRLAIAAGKTALWLFGGDPGRDRCP